MGSKSILYRSYIKSSKHRLEHTKKLLLKVQELSPDPINEIIIRRYLEHIELKERFFLEKSIDKNVTIQDFDISGIESDVSIFLEDIVLNKKNEFDFFSKIKCIFQSVGAHLIFYPSIQMESNEARVFDDIFLIGVPAAVLNERDYFPLIFHEIGHSLLDSSNFSSLSDFFKIEIEKLKKRAFNGANLDQVNVRYLNRANFYLRILNLWIPEITSDIFGAYFIGLPYFFAFLLYQLNKKYFSSIEDHPSNGVRFLYLLKYFQRSDELNNKEDLGKLIEIVNTDEVLDAKSRILRVKSTQDLFFDGFDAQIEEYSGFKEIRSEVRKIFENSTK